jgi:hypothetical protein
VDSIDADMAARFLAALSRDNLHTFQTFDDAGRGRRGLIQVPRGTFARLAPRLATLNAKGAGVFVMVNRGDGRGRKAENVIGARALFVDLDGAPLEPVLSASIPPRIVVESSLGRWHAYWPIADMPLEQFTTAQKALAEVFNADPKVHDRPRVMRLPGFLHRKGEPFLTRLVECNAEPLTWDEMAQAFDLSRRLILPATIPKGDRNDTIYKLAKSAAAKGVPEAEQLAKLAKVNAQRCSPPLSDAELRQIAASAYRNAAEGAASIPLAVLDGEPYKALDDACRTLLLLAYRRADGFNPFPLPWSELRAWFPRKNTFNDVRKRLVESGLLRVERPAEVAMPRKGRGPKPFFYRLAIGPKSATYSNARIGPFGVAPEAFQAVASRKPLTTAADSETETVARGFR